MNAEEPRTGHWPLVRTFALVALSIAVLVPGALWLRPSGASSTSVASGSTAPPEATADETVAGTDGASTSSSTSSTAVASTTTTMPAPSTVADDGRSSAERRLQNEFVVSDADLQPKSIVASGTGLFVAQNMMYRHNVMVLDTAGTWWPAFPTPSIWPPTACPMG